MPTQGAWCCMFPQCVCVVLCGPWGQGAAITVQAEDHTFGLVISKQLVKGCEYSNMSEVVVRFTLLLGVLSFVSVSKAQGMEGIFYEKSCKTNINVDDRDLYLHGGGVILFVFLQCFQPVTTSQLPRQCQNMGHLTMEIAPMLLLVCMQGLTS